MSGYRDELDSALRQLDELRAEATRLRGELDETRRASASSVAHAMVGWSHAKPRTRLAIVLGPAATAAVLGAVVLGVTALDARRPTPNLGAVEPLTRDHRAGCPPCPEQRPCIQRHARPPTPEPDALPAAPAVTELGNITTPGPWQGLPFLSPTHEDTRCDPREGTLVLHTRGAGSCVIGTTTFSAPATLRLRQGDYDLHCASWDGRLRKQWRVRVEAGMVTATWYDDLSKPLRRGEPMRPDAWTPMPPMRN